MGDKELIDIALVRYYKNECWTSDRDLIKRLAIALSAHQWVRIEDAPESMKNGPADVWSPTTHTYPVRAVWHSAYSHWQDIEDQGWGNHVVLRPTHIRPIPAPPEPDGEQK